MQLNLKICISRRGLKASINAEILNHLHSSGYVDRASKSSICADMAKNRIVWLRCSFLFLASGKEYTRGSNGGVCGTGLVITDLEECKRAVLALGIDTGSTTPWVASSTIFAYGCSTEGSANHIHFNSNTNGKPRMSGKPICIKSEGNILC